MDKTLHFYLFFFLFYLYFYLVWSYSEQSNIVCVSKLQKCYITILSFSNFNDPTNGLFFEFELLKIADAFKMQKFIFMFDFVDNDIHP